MKKRSSIGVLTHPVNINAVVRVDNADSDGTLCQNYDALSGAYYPDRAARSGSTYISPTLLGLHVLITDPNTANQTTTEHVFTTGDTVRWYIVSSGVVTEVTGSAVPGFTVSGYNLRITRNIQPSENGMKVRAVGTFTDSVGKVHQVQAEEPLTVSVSSAENLSLATVVTNGTYAGNLCVLNPLKFASVAEFSAAASWKRKCRVQLRDGVIDVPDAFQDGDGDDTPEGTAYYFWFQRIGHRLVRLTEDVEWFDADWYANGTVSKEVTVDLLKVKDVKLVCRAGYIPYGELVDYADEDGIISPSKLYQGYREQEFHLRVETPLVQRIVVADMAKGMLERTELGSSEVTIRKRALITAGGKTVNDLSVTVPPLSASLVDNLFNITWYAINPQTGVATSVGTGEWLVTTPQEIGATSASNLPEMEVEVTPNYPQLTGNNYVEGRTRNASGNLSGITPLVTQGNKGFLRQIDFFLLDTTDNDGTATGSRLLRRNNLLRYAGGDYAPVVHITTTQAADAELQLFRKNSSNQYVEYCAAGEYEPESFVESVLRPYYENGSVTGWASGYPTLYKSDGNDGYIEAHALLPWETTEKRWSIGAGFNFDVYLLDHVVGASGTEWNGIFTDVTEWDGIDLTPYLLKPTALSPGPICTISDNGVEKARNMFYLHQGMTGCRGYYGANKNTITAMFHDNERTYPRVEDVAAVKAMTVARANNANANSPVPFAEGGYHTLNTLCTALELLYSRLNPFRETQFGSGISSNGTCDSETTWRTNGGIRHRQQGTAPYSYAQWNATAAFATASGTSKTTWNNTLAYEGPKEQCMESQMAASFATEFEIGPTTNVSSPVWFEMYGGRYYYMNVDGALTMADGFMNAKVYRELTDTISAWDASGNAVTWEVSALLRMSLFGGLNLSGDILAYCQGGAECIGTCTIDPATSKAGNPVDCYIITNQEHWVRDTEVTKNAGTTFAIENSEHAIHLGQGETLTNCIDGYAKRRLGYSPMKIANGGDLTSGECYYAYTRNEWCSTVGKRARIALRFRGNANNAYCSPRSWNASHSAGHTSRYYGSLAQARIRERS